MCVNCSVVVLESGLETVFEGLGLGLGQQGLDSGQSGLGILPESTASPAKKQFFSHLDSQFQLKINSLS